MATLRDILYGVQNEVAALIMAVHPDPPKTEPLFRRRTADAHGAKAVRELTGVGYARVFDFSTPTLEGQEYHGATTAVYRYTLPLTFVYPSTHDWMLQVHDDMHLIARTITDNFETIRGAVAGCQFAGIVASAVWTPEQNAEDPTSYFSLPITVIADVA